MGMPRYTWIQVEEFICETDLACLFSINDEEVWIPKSVLRDDNFDEDDEFFDIAVLTWFAEEKELI